MRKNRLVVESTVLSSNVFTRPSKKINKIIKIKISEKKLLDSFY